ncbi:hypothetical protein QBC47DRAFT_48165 [Echria macrotheca]|uniref:F-box domain-containing protein n=1 Tax=Echria macrotheca TaxID=438768 RepID=A0AAJ0BDE0_9PEZI|nr:hypothetical protein QBC47DRAFT_48165 [Echria macrotheca]
MADAVHRLPPEAWANVCAHLDEHDLVNFRCVCKSFAEIGLPFALAELTIFPHQDDFANLRAVANDPNRAKHVRSIIYIPYMLETRYLERAIDFGQYVMTWRSLAIERHQSFKDGRPPTPPIPDDEELNVKYAHFNSAIEQMRGIIDRGLDAACFSEVLPKFPGLREVWLRSGTGLETSKTFGQRFVKKSPYDNAGYCLRKDYFYPGSGLRGIRALMPGLLSCKPRLLRVLRLDSVDWDFLKELPPPSALAGLVELEIEFALTRPWLSTGNPPFQRREVRGMIKPGLLRDFLSALPNLEALTLRADYYAVMDGHQSSVAIEPTYPWSLNDIVPTGIVWPHLRRFGLATCECSGEELLDFILRHRDTLRSLDLGYIKLDTSWRPFLHAIRDKMRGRLKEAWIWGHMRGPIVDGENEYCKLGKPKWSRGRIEAPKGNPDEPLDESVLNIME